MMFLHDEAAHSDDAAVSAGEDDAGDNDTAGSLDDFVVDDAVENENHALGKVERSFTSKRLKSLDASQTCDRAPQ